MPSCLPPPAEPCEHSRKGPCRFVDSRAGCRFGDGCQFCHLCKRVSTFDKIQAAIKRRRAEGCGSAAGASPLAPEDFLRVRPAVPGLLRVLDRCPELLLESVLGAALPAAEVSALLCVHRAVTALAAGDAASLLWRLQLRRIRSPSGRAVVAPALLASLPASQLRRATRALAGVAFKSEWLLETCRELTEHVAVIESARQELPPGAALFAFSVAYQGSGGAAAEQLQEAAPQGGEADGAPAGEDEAEEADEADEDVGLAEGGEVEFDGAPAPVEEDIHDEAWGEGLDLGDAGGAADAAPAEQPPLGGAAGEAGALDEGEGADFRLDTAGEDPAAIEALGYELFEEEAPEEAAEEAVEEAAEEGGGVAPGDFLALSNDEEEDAADQDLPEIVAPTLMAPAGGRAPLHFVSVRHLQPLPGDAAFAFPSGAEFRVSLTLSIRPIMSLNSDAIVGRSYSVHPTVTGLWSFDDIPELRGARFTGKFWSASPSFCPIQALDILSEAKIPPAAAQQLLARDPHARATLRLFGCIRCTQRFWDVALT